MKFVIHDNVTIHPLECTGRIIGIYINEVGIKYEIRYFVNSEIKVEYFYEEELSLKHD